MEISCHRVLAVAQLVFEAVMLAAAAYATSSIRSCVVEIRAQCYNATRKVVNSVLEDISQYLAASTVLARVENYT